MHELSIAMSVIEEALQVLEREKGSKVISLTLQIGKLSGVEHEPLEFCFPLAAQGTALEKAVLIIEPVEIALFCDDCKREGEILKPFLICPHCSSRSVKVVKGRELAIKALEIE